MTGSVVELAKLIICSSRALIWDEMEEVMRSVMFCWHVPNIVESNVWKCLLANGICRVFHCGVVGPKDSLIFCVLLFCMVIMCE